MDDCPYVGEEDEKRGAQTKKDGTMSLKLVNIIIVYILCIIMIATGWGINLYKLTQCDFESPYKAEVIRTIGIIPPIGAIVGWIDLGK